MFNYSTKQILHSYSFAPAAIHQLIYFQEAVMQITWLPVSSFAFKYP